MIVWIPMRPEGSEEAARATACLCGGSRVDHFDDEERSAGRAIARSLGGEGIVAWDVYRVYPPFTTWQRVPPPPFSWTHQLRESTWADRARYQTGDGLMSELRRSVTGLLQTP